MLSKVGRWTWRDIYRLPVAIVLWPLVLFDYRQRGLGRRPDRWYWADVLLMEMGYALRR